MNEQQRRYIQSDPTRHRDSYLGLVAAIIFLTACGLGVYFGMFIARILAHGG